jgi:hypothetical protein
MGPSELHTSRFCSLSSSYCSVVVVVIVVVTVVVVVVAASEPAFQHYVRTGLSSLVRPLAATTIAEAVEALQGTDREGT